MTNITPDHPNSNSQDLLCFITARAGLFDVSLLAEIKAVTITFFADEFGAVLPSGEVRRGGMDDLS
jgi:hypothetical protein